MGVTFGKTITIVGWLTVAGLGLRGDSTRNTLKFIEPNPRVVHALPLCLINLNPPPRPSKVPGLYTRMCSTFADMAQRIAHKRDLFKSRLWKDLKESLSPLSDAELVGFCGSDKTNLSWLKCNIARAGKKAPDFRQTLLLQFLINNFGIDGLAGFNTGELSLDRGQLKKGVKIFKRLSSKIKNRSRTYLSYQHLAFMHVENVDDLNVPLFVMKDRNCGKWEIVTNTQENAIRIAEALLPCFDSGNFESLKFDLTPKHLGPSVGDVYRVIVYTSDHDPLVEGILRRITDKELLWIYEWQTYEGSILKQALFKLGKTALAKKTELSRADIESIRKALRDKKFMLELGLSEFQYQVLLTALFLSMYTDLTDPVTYTAHDVLPFPALTWRFLAVALEPENQDEFRGHLQNIRTEMMSVFKD